MSLFTEDEDEDLVENRLIEFSHVTGFIVLGFSLLAIFLLFYLEVGGNASPVEIYVRIISSVVSLLILSVFFELFFKYNTYMEVSSRRLKIISLCLAVAGFIKVAVSIYYLVLCAINGNAVGFFYLGEIIVWTAVAVFSILYRKTLDE